MCGGRLSSPRHRSPVGRLPAATEELAFKPEQMLVCGMALGYADPEAVENSLVTERALVSEFARFIE